MQNENLELLARVEVIKQAVARNPELGDSWEFMQKLQEVETLMANEFQTTREQLFASA